MFLTCVVSPESVSLRCPIYVILCEQFIYVLVLKKKGVLSFQLVFIRFHLAEERTQICQPVCC